MAGKLVPTGTDGKEVILSPIEKLKQFNKTELAEMIIAEQLKYKKLKTKNTNKNKEADDAVIAMEGAADTIIKLGEALELANDDAANLSNTLLLKNRTQKEVNEIIIDLIRTVDLALKTSMKLLELNGVVGGQQ